VSKNRIFEEQMMRFPRRARTSVLAVGVLTAASVLAACGSSGSDANSKTVTIWSSIDQPVQDGLNQVLTKEAKAKGITVKWQKVDNINQLIMQKIQAKDTPDIAFIPQPGVVGDIVKRHAAFPLDDVVDMSTLKSSMLPGTLGPGTINGKLYGLLVSTNVKSLVYYPKKAWASAGYTPPTDLTGLEQLTDKIKSDGNTPWCMGIEADTATGWPATDWFEDLIMRLDGPDAYNDWVSHKIKFDSPEVKKAAAEFEKLLFTSGNVLGGRKAIPSTNFGTAGNPMFATPKPKCWMYRQGSFITGFFPKAVTSNVDANVGVFYFPPAAGSTDKPVLGGGDLATMLTNNKSTKTVMKFLSQTNIGEVAAGNGSTFISPHKDFDVSKYPNQTTKIVAGIANSATTVLFDGSDQMPGEVGAGSFWKDMTSWIAGQESLDAALKSIDASWPKS
jgi:alpha-glucoside transport system substrate-binding protein